MKILTWLSALAFTFLALPFVAMAQIAPSGIFREQPTSTPTPTLTPKPSPAQTPAVDTTVSTGTPPVAKSPKQTAKAETKPTPNARPTPAVAVDEARPSGTGGETVLKLRQMEREWEASSRNTATIQKMVADDFIGVTSEGKIVTKKSMLKESTDEKADSSSSVGHMDVRLHGPQVAIVVGTAKQSTKDKAGKKSTTSYRFTDTWVERGGNWQCIASQSIALPNSSERAAASRSPNVQTGSNLPRRRY